MGKLYNVKRKKESKNGNRFYTKLDMAIIKHDTAVHNSEINRGEVEKKGNNEYVSVCGCGVEGCFIHGDFASIPQEEFDKFQESKQHKHH